MRFVAAGGCNTLLSYAIYWGLLAIADYRIAYLASYVVTIFTGFALNTWFVFRTRWSWRKLAMFPGIYVVNFVIGLAIVWAGTSLLGVPVEVAPMIATVIVIPLGFVLSRMLFKASPDRP